MSVTMTFIVNPLLFKLDSEQFNVQKYISSLLVVFLNQ